MNWDAVGAVGEILGALGVLLTLVYLAIQVRHAANISWSQKAYAQAAYEQQTFSLQASPEMVAAVEKCYYTDEPLSVSDCIWIESYIVSALIDFRTNFEHYQKGLMSQGQWEQRKRSIQPWFSADYPKMWWQGSKHRFEDPFIEEIDELVLSAPELNRRDVMSVINRNRPGSPGTGT